MQTHNVVQQHKRMHARSVGRGGKRGKTSGRGTKGQKARSGRKIRPEIRDVIKRLPKLRGRGKNSFKGFQSAWRPVNLSAVEAAFSAGENVTPEVLVQKGIVANTEGKAPRVKILGDGELTKKLSFSSIFTFSASAKAKIEMAGGLIK